ncbi:MAG: hypothetical protein JWP31_1010, partial [Aeromicrobium sp.]|nr:hypothetical protein [Aeromicrobium sp.]
WQLAAGLSFGMACATKWNGVYVLATFAVLAVVWEVMARKRAPQGDVVRADGWIRTALVVGTPAFVTIVVVALAVYLVTWTGFLVHHEVYEARFGRGYGDYSDPWGSYVDHPTTGFLGGTRDAFRSLWHFHVMTWNYHTTGLNTAEHPYQSNPWGWLLQLRPVSADAQFDLPASTRCGQSAGDSCVREILILGNPVLWWTGAVALVGVAVTWIVTAMTRLRSGTRASRTPLWSVPVLGVLVCWLPWLRFDDRPIFSFYAVVIVPFTIIAICFVIHALIQAATTPSQRYATGLLIGFYLAAVVVTFWFFHPVYTDALIPQDAWDRRMWLQRWI